MDPAEALDNSLSWYDREKFKIGFFLGFVAALVLVWMGS